MLERIHFLVMYVGSAAMVAFLAACLSSPQVSMFSCETSDSRGAEQCELAATLAAFALENDGLTLGDSNPLTSTSGQESVSVATAH